MTYNFAESFPAALANCLEFFAGGPTGDVGRLFKSTKRALQQLFLCYHWTSWRFDNSPGRNDWGGTGTEVRTVTLGLAKVFTLLFRFLAFAKVAPPTVLPLSNYPRPGTPTPGSLFLLYPPCRFLSR
jgi:hypothetical protein